MGLLKLKNQLNQIESIVFKDNKDKWRLNTIFITHKGKEQDINNDKKYYLEYQNKQLVYDNINDFYNDYNIYPKKDINPIIIDIVDNSYLEQVLYNADD